MEIVGSQTAYRVPCKRDGLQNTCLIFFLHQTITFCSQTKKSHLKRVKIVKNLPVFLSSHLPHPIPQTPHQTPLEKQGAIPARSWDPTRVGSWAR